LMTAGLLAKAALYPFHLWLHPPMPALRLRPARYCRVWSSRRPFPGCPAWFDVMPRLPEHSAAQFLAF
jgi:hypothetical protein